MHFGNFFSPVFSVLVTEREIRPSLNSNEQNEAGEKKKKLLQFKTRLFYFQSLPLNEKKLIALLIKFQGQLNHLQNYFMTSLSLAKNLPGTFFR